jgi:hypothetical protein
MKKLWQTLIPWVPFAFALFLCQLVLSQFTAPGMRSWEPAFYSFLPMGFFAVGAVTFSMQREIRELRNAVAMLQASATVRDLAA